MKRGLTFYSDRVMAVPRTIDNLLLSKKLFISIKIIISITYYYIFEVAVPWLFVLSKLCTFHIFSNNQFAILFSDSRKPLIF